MRIKILSLCRVCCGPSIIVANVEITLFIKCLCKEENTRFSCLNYQSTPVVGRCSYQDPSHGLLLHIYTHTHTYTHTYTYTHTHTHFAKKFACTGVWLTRSFWFAEWLETHQPPQLVDAWTSRTLSMFKDKHFGCCKDIGLSDLVVQTQLDEILKCAGGDRRCWRKRKGRAREKRRRINELRSFHDIFVNEIEIDLFALVRKLEI